MFEQLEVADATVVKARGHDKEAFIDTNLGGGQAERVDFMLFETLPEWILQHLDFLQGLLAERKHDRFWDDFGLPHQVDQLHCVLHN